MSDCFESKYVALLLSCTDNEKLEQVAEVHGSTVAAVIRGLIKQAIADESINSIKPIRSVHKNVKGDKK